VDALHVYKIIQQVDTLHVYNNVTKNEVSKHKKMFSADIVVYLWSSKEEISVVEWSGVEFNHTIAVILGRPKKLGGYR
jgi:hypothetical protein